MRILYFQQTHWLLIPLTKRLTIKHQVAGVMGHNFFQGYSGGNCDISSTANKNQTAGTSPPSDGAVFK